MTNEELKALAEKASPIDEWYKPGDLRYADDKTGEIHGIHHDDDSFIAAANPAAVLGLITDAERSEKHRNDQQDTIVAQATEIVALKAECEGLRAWIQALTK